MGRTSRCSAGPPAGAGHSCHTLQGNAAVSTGPLSGFPHLFPQDRGTQTFTLHAVGAVCHQDLVLAQADVALLPREPVGARALPGARVTGAPSALALCRVE